MKKLDLSGNQLRTLPSSLSFLKELTTLDLSGNPIQSLKMVERGLTSLPKLIDLRIQFKSKMVRKNNQKAEKDMADVAMKLPNLKFLNGISFRESRKSMSVGLTLDWVRKSQDLQRRKTQNIF